MNLETFLDEMTWMKAVSEKGVALGPEPWHMHPVLFLSSLVDENEMALKWLKVPKGQLTFDVEGNDINTSPWFSRKIHWPGGVSGVTIGRGYDLGQQATANADLTQIGITEPLKSWLVSSQGLSATDAQSRLNPASESIRNSTITRKQQYDMFMVSYQRLEDDGKRICQKTNTIRVYHPNPQATPEQAWSDIPEKIKEILVDLRYRGDYTPRARTLIQRYAYSGDLNSFGNVLSTRSNWLNVPEERFNQKVSFYES
ncbi:pesticin C-terminus-like muramidase [Cronobacter turicensis]